MTWRTGPNEAAVTTTSASWIAASRGRGGRRGRDPGGRLRLGREGRGTVGVSVEHREMHAGEHAAEHREMAPALDARPDERRTWRPPAHDRREPADRHAGHGRGPQGGDRTAVEDRARQPGQRIVEDDDRVDRRQPEGVVPAEPGDPLHAEKVVRTRRVGAAQVGRHGVCERAGRARVDADLGRQLGIGDEGRQGPFGEHQPFVEVGHRGEHVRGGEVPHGRAVGRGRHGPESTRGRWPTMTSCPPSTSSRASTT